MTQIEGPGTVRTLAGGDVPDHPEPDVIGAPDPAVAIVDVERPEEPQPGEQGSAFDTSRFTLPRPEVDGVETDTMKVSFSGTWELDPMNADDVAFFNRLQRGQSLDLQVEAEVTDRSAPYKRNPSTDEETITGVAKVKVIHVHRLSPEQL